MIERDPLCSAYREYEVCGMGGSSSGGIAVGQIVGILNQFAPEQLKADQVQTLRLLGGYVQSPAVLEHIDEYIVAPALFPVLDFAVSAELRYENKRLIWMWL